MSSTINNTKPEILWFESEMYIEILKWLSFFLKMLSQMNHLYFIPLDIKKVRTTICQCNVCTKALTK